MNKYDASYWASRYFEAQMNAKAREHLERDIDAKWGDSLLTKMMEHWKKLVDQPTRPCGDKCTIHPCPCGHPERHCKGCSGASPEDQLASKANGEGSTPSAPAIERMSMNWQAMPDVKFISIHYKSGAVYTSDGQFSSYMPADWKPRLRHAGTVCDIAHETAAAFEACRVCHPVQKMDHLPEGSH